MTHRKRDNELYAAVKRLLIVIIWIGCGILGSGFSNATFRAKYPILYSDAAFAKRTGRGDMGMFVLFGPFGLVGGFLCTGFGSDGWTLSTEPTPYPWEKR